MNDETQNYRIQHILIMLANSTCNHIKEGAVVILSETILCNASPNYK